MPAERLPDQDQREAALDPARSFIVQAPAGSGKTELLIQRYLALLARVPEPEAVLAITFTRKAVAEMRRRVIEALAAARAEATPAGDHERRTLTLAAAALAHSDMRGWAIEDNPNRLNFRTIDAFCLALTRQLPVTARLGGQPETVEDADALYRDAARATLEELEHDGEWSEAIERLLAHLDNHLPRVEALLAGMLAKRDQWLNTIVAAPARADMEAALARLSEEILTAAAAAWPVATATEVAALGRYAAANLQAAGGDSAITALADLDGLPQARVADLPAWRGLAQLLLTDQGWRRRVDASIGFPAPASAATAADRARCSEMKSRLQELLATLAATPGLDARLAAVRALPDAAYSDEQWQLMAGLFQLLKLAAARLELVAAEQGVIDFLGVSLAAVRALGGADVPTDLALALDYRLQHILVDEFQDTSLAQYRLLEQLTDGWTAGDGRTLFLVGDPMQSIYRFREAQVGLFLKTLAARRLGQVALAPLQLTANLRAHAGLVEWVNAAFTHVLPAEADLGLGGVPHVPAQAVWPAPPGAEPAVTVHAAAGNDPEVEARAVVERVQSALAMDPDGSVAILVRNRDHLAAIAPALKQAGLAFRAVEIEGLAERPAVLDLLALTRALLHPADRIAWLAVLRAPWCGLTLADLVALAGDDDRVTIWDCLNDARRLRALSDDGRARAAYCAECLRPALAGRRRRPLRRFVEGVWLALGGPAVLESGRDLDNAWSFFELLDELDSGGELADPAVLEERVQRLYAVPEGAADTLVQVMTMHKAKGLEFDTVILPGLGRGKRPPDPQLLMWLRYYRLDGDDLLFAPIKRADESRDPLYRWLAGLDAQAGGYEDMRLLYVAATRARRCLHVFGHLPLRSQREGDAAPRLRDRPQAGSLLGYLWPAVADRFADPAAQPAALPARTGTAAPAPAIRRLPVDWQAPSLPARVPVAGRPAMVQPEQPIEFAWVGRGARLAGIVLHQWLQRIALDGLAQWTPARVEDCSTAIRRALAAYGMPEAELDDAVRRVQTGVVNTLTDVRGRWLLGADHAEAHSEFPLGGTIDGEIVNVRIDRTLIDAQGVRWIVDYKTGVHAGGDPAVFLDREQERYRAQLERYAALMRSLDDRPIRLGLYFPMLAGWREWPA